jgi:ribosomal protein S18 acetylase RimI-like enzyme
MLRKAYANSLCTLAAYDGENVVGVIRAVGDGASIVFIQDLLIYPAYQRMGISSALLRAMMARYPEVYQMELMTDDTPRLRGFYESYGLTDAAELGCLTYVKLQ